jgi:hypothetical protein
MIPASGEVGGSCAAGATTEQAVIASLPNDITRRRSRNAVLMQVGRDLVIRRSGGKSTIYLRALRLMLYTS